MKNIRAKSLIIWSFFILCCVPQVGQAQLVPDSTDVVIDIGHGGVDGGTSQNGVLEKDINLAIGKKLYQLLQNQSFVVGITRLDDYALSDESLSHHIQSRHVRDLKQRKLIADTLRPKLFLSLHVNWSKNKNQRGPVVIYQPTNASYTAAHLVQYHLNELFGIQKLPHRGDRYFLMKNLQMSSLIIEMGFLSNPQDLSYLLKEESQNKIAAALAHAVGEYFLIYPY